MGLSLWLYVVAFGWQFAIMMMLMLITHEGGHWIVMKAYGLQPKAPVFIPFVGAYVAMSKMPKDEYVHAWVAYAGPFIGGIFAIAVYMIGLLTNTLWLMAGGAFGCMLNLLQLIPAWIFDGKFIIKAISNWLLIPGIFIMLAVAFIWQSPFLFIISIVSIFSLIKQFRKPRITDQPSLSAMSNKNVLWQRCLISVAYLVLVGTLAAAYSIENSKIAQKMPQLGELSAGAKNPAMTLLMGGGLSKIVPDGKTASEYYMLGFQYKSAGWTEQARESIMKAIAIDGGGTIAKKAEIFLKTRLPRYPVPENAVLMNIAANGENSFFTRDKAEAIWKQCIGEYPKFEWPYNNLSDLYIQKGKFKEAEKLLNSALNINPNYVNAWIHLAECKLKENDKIAAQNCVNKALELEPDDIGTKLMSLRIRLYELLHIS